MCLFVYPLVQILFSTSNFVRFKRKLSYCYHVGNCERIKYRSCNTLGRTYELFPYSSIHVAFQSFIVIDYEISIYISCGTLLFYVVQESSVI
jgi:hypothetical protein